MPRAPAEAGITLSAPSSPQENNANADANSTHEQTQEGKKKDEEEEEKDDVRNTKERALAAAIGARGGHVLLVLGQPEQTWQQVVALMSPLDKP